ncbi:MAG: hypothetical protein ACOZQL_31505 [Myxococcota bacterium]
MVRHATSVFVVAALALSACSLLVSFNPDDQPCDSLGLCLDTHDCIDGKCRARDGGVTDGGARTENCANGTDDDGDSQVDCADSDCGGKGCSDGDPCTEGEVCSNGMCPRGAAKTCNTPSSCQSASGTCEPGTGRCVYPPLADGVSCGGTAAARCCAGNCVSINSDGANCGGCGLTCSTGQACQDISTNSCGPVSTSGRCTCTPDAGTSACPMGQTCNSRGLCVPAGMTTCAPNERVVTADAGCPSFCSY